MTDKIEITPELLADLKVKAGKATQGKWVGYYSDKGSTEHINGAVNNEDGHILLVNKPNCENNTKYIAAANPTVILALIEHIERLEEDFDAAARSAADESVKAVKLDEEADWLAEYSARDECPLETLGWDKNPEDRPQWCDWHYDVNDNVYGSDCSGGCAECWRILFMLPQAVPQFLACNTNRLQGSGERQ